MPATIVVGGQFGSEGKGKVAHYLVRERRATVAVRVGGSNSGHTVYDDRGKRHVFRHLPTASVLPDPICALGPGSYIEPDVLKREMETIGLSKERLVIDPHAFVITEEHKKREQQLRLGERIGSTLSGTGEAVVDRARRLSAENLAKNHPFLSQFTEVGPVRRFLRERLNLNEWVVVEGTQGFGLSVLHSPYYPKATSRDTTAAAFTSEAGMSPLDVEEVVLVIRAFPIRVPGDSGYLPLETDWETVAREGGWPDGLVERTSVTQNIRRVARFDPAIVREAIEANTPSLIVLNHADYFDERCSRTGEITPKILSRLNRIELAIARPIDLIGLDPINLRLGPDYKGRRLLA